MGTPPGHRMKKGKIRKLLEQRFLFAPVNRARRTLLVEILKLAGDMVSYFKTFLLSWTVPPQCVMFGEFYELGRTWDLN